MTAPVEPDPDEDPNDPNQTGHIYVSTDENDPRPYRSREQTRRRIRGEKPWD